MDLTTVIQDPLQYIENELRTSSSSRNNDPHGQLGAAIRAFITEQAGGSLNAIPVLNPDTWQRDHGIAKNHSLVRFRGMVQDMPDPEFFVGVHRRPANNNALVYTMYRDTLDEAEEGALEPHETMERRPLMLTPIPGEASWAKLIGPNIITTMLNTTASSSASSSSVPSQQRPKRALEASSSSSGTPSSEAGNAMMDDDSMGGDRKVPRTEEAGDVKNDDSVAAMEEDTAAPTTSKQVNRPSSFRCMAYLYGSEEAHPPKLNEAIDVIGVLSVLSPFTSDDDAKGEGVENAMRADRSIMQSIEEQQPRLHVLLWTRAGMVANEDINAFAQTSIYPKPLNLPSGEGAILPRLREEIINRLARGLSGDTLAAEYLLLNLVSRVHLRNTGGEVGHLPLNLSRVTDEQVQQGFGIGLGHLLSELVGRSQVANVNLQTLADPKAWIPAKDYETNVLSNSPLQLAPGTTLVLDETGLDSGRLTSEGVANVQCLKTLIESMKTTYNFGFYQLNFETDCPIIILSRGRSILGGGAVCEVPMASQQQQDQLTLPALSQESITMMRSYIAQLAGYPVEFDRTAAAQAEQEYVALRGREEGKGLCPEDLGRWITITRLICATLGESKVRMEDHWKRMRHLETTRVQRLKIIAGDSSPSQ